MASRPVTLSWHNDEGGLCEITCEVDDETLGKLMRDLEDGEVG